MKMLENFKKRPLYYITSLSILFGSFYLMDKYLQGGYYNYIKYHQEKKIDKQRAIDDLARERIRKRKEAEENQQQQQQQQQNNNN